MLLRTKLYAPQMRDGAVLRERLLSALDAPVSGALTLLHAPAGYGKTTLIRQWLQARDYTYAWLSLDEQENDSARFWRYVIGAIQSVHPGVGERALAQFLVSAEPSHRDVVVELINDLVMLEVPLNGIALMLVFDDFHVITNAQVCESVSWFLDNLPASVHVAITSRTQPEIAIPRRRVRNALIEISSQQLNFLPEEILQFFDQTMHTPISVEASVQLKEKTAGWVAGLQLAALSMQGTERLKGEINVPDFSGSHQYVVRYLEQEILATMSGALRDFLLLASALPRFSIALCDAVMPISNQREKASDKASLGSASLLRALEQQNLFLIPLDDRGEWFRFHHFFSDALLQIACAEMPHELALVQRKAAAWFEQRNFPEDALFQLFSVEDFEAAARLIEEIGFDRMLAGHNESLEWWLQQLPEKTIRVRPKLCLIRAWGLFATPEVLDAEFYLDTAEEELQKTPAENQDLQRHIAIFRTQLARIQGDNEKADYYSRQLFDQPESEFKRLPSAAQLAMGLDAYSTGDLLKAVTLLKSALHKAKSEENSFSVLATSMVLSQTYFQQGYSQRGLVQCDVDREWLLAHKQDPYFVDCWQNMVRVEILREMQRDQEAEAGLQFLLNYAENGAPPQHVSSIALIEVSFLAVAEEFEKIEPVLEKIQSILAGDASQYAHFSPDVDAVRVKYALRTGDYKTALAWFDSPRKQDRNNTPYNLQQENILRARVLSHQGRFEEGLALLKQTEAEADAGQCRINVLRCMIAEVLIRYAEGGAPEALPVLRDALRLASDSYRRLFLDEGEVIDLLFCELSNSGYVGWWSDQIASDRSESDKTPVGMALASKLCDLNSPALVEPLTAREQQILELIAQGMSNQQIADHLSIALATTKAHVRNLFEKLAVNRRTHAIATARSMGLLR